MKSLNPKLDENFEWLNLSISKKDSFNYHFHLQSIKSIKVDRLSCEIKLMITEN